MFLTPGRLTHDCKAPWSSSQTVPEWSSGHQRHRYPGSINTAPRASEASFFKPIISYTIKLFCLVKQCPQYHPWARGLHHLLRNIPCRRRSESFAMPALLPCRLRQSVAPSREKVPNVYERTFLISKHLPATYNRDISSHKTLLNISLITHAKFKKNLIN